MFLVTNNERLLADWRNERAWCGGNKHREREASSSSLAPLLSEKDGNKLIVAIIQASHATHVSMWMDEFEEHNTNVGGGWGDEEEERNNNCLVMLVGNKMDLDRQRPEDGSRQGWEDLREEWGWDGIHRNFGLGCDWRRGCIPKTSAGTNMRRPRCWLHVIQHATTTSRSTTKNAGSVGGINRTTLLHHHHHHQQQPRRGFLYSHSSVTSSPHSKANVPGERISEPNLIVANFNACYENWCVDGMTCAVASHRVSRPSSHWAHHITLAIHYKCCVGGTNVMRKETTS